MGPFQIIFNPTSVAELGGMPKRLQLEFLGQFRGIPQEMVSSSLEQFGKLVKGSRTLYRFRLGEYRVYFERHKLGVVVHRILARNSLKDFLYRSNLKASEDSALEENPRFWEKIEEVSRES